jgi:hypothetical protein
MHHNYVFTNLKLENDSIIKANCLCHVLHDTTKHGLVKYSLDIENLIMKIFAHFLISAKRVENLKSCYEFTESQYKNWSNIHPLVG